MSTLELEQHEGGAVGVLDVQRLYTWVRFRAVIEERETASGPQPMVTKLEATDDDGEVVPIGQSEHASITLVFLQAYYRWRRQACRSPVPTAP